MLAWVAVAVALFLVFEVTGGTAVIMPSIGGGASVRDLIREAAASYGIDPSLPLGIAAHESGFDASATHLNQNGTKDWGVMQLNDLTVQTLGVSNPLDARENVFAGVGLLAGYLGQYGDVDIALWAYSAGPGAVAAGTGRNQAFIDFVKAYRG